MIVKTTIRILVIVFLLAAVFYYITRDPILKKAIRQPNADIFLFDDVVYKNAIDIQWVQERELTLGEEVGSITRNSKIIFRFKNNSATKLPKGTKIFRPNEKSGDILLIKIGDEVIRYFGWREG